MNLIDRLNYYGRELPSEKPIFLKSDSNAFPIDGEIVVESLTVSYPSNPNVNILEDFSCKFQSGEKIGICGRTGSGKSTFVSCLFRLIEAKSGTIHVGGVDIGNLGLNTLRNGILIVPQNPVLFSGTIRSNIDDGACDNDLWDVLESVDLKDFVSGLDQKLDSPVESFGANLSFGQRQLLHMARVLYKRPKVLIMDEATASVDQETDRLIQQTIKSKLATTTVLTIAHKIQSLINFDKVVVLEKGKIIEFDTPTALLENSRSRFYDLFNTQTKKTDQTSR